MGEAGQKALRVYAFEKLPDDSGPSYTQPFERTCHLLSPNYIRASLVPSKSLFQNYSQQMRQVGGDAHGLSTFAPCQQWLGKS